jgi:hypothetical protein
MEELLGKKDTNGKSFIASSFEFRRQRLVA